MDTMSQYFASEFTQATLFTSELSTVEVLSSHTLRLDTERRWSQASETTTDIMLFIGMLVKRIGHSSMAVKKMS